MEIKINGSTNKKECEECHNFYKHIEKCADGKFRCKRCKRKLVTNKWYIPKELRKPITRIGKFNMTLQEKNLLHKQGKSWKEINGACKYMKKVSWSKRKKDWDNKKNEKNKKIAEKQQMKKLIEGLKQ